ncbi:MAG: efflux RND transporter permease subunit [Myxococcales bacterium]|nr:efflux RND transporter permease subunit [Myxococcales bacterium]
MISNAPTRPEAESGVFRTWGRIAQRLRWPVIALCLGITAFLTHQLFTALVIDNSNEAFMEAGSDADRRLTALRDAFGRDELFLVLVEGDVFTLDYLKRLRALHEDLEEIDLELESLGERKADRDRQRLRGTGGATGAIGPGSPAAEDNFGEFGDEGWGAEAGGSVVDQVMSLVNARRTRSVGGGLRVDALLDEAPTEATLPALRAHVLKDRALLGQLVGAEGRHSVLAVRTAFMSEEDSGEVSREIDRILDRHRAPDFLPSVAGMPAILVALNEAMLHDMQLGMTLTTVVLVLVMAFIFRHWQGVVGPVLVVLQAALWTIGTIAVTGAPMTMVTSVLGAFLMVVGVGDSVHLLSIYRDARSRGVDNAEAITHAVATTGMPVLFTSITTAGGLLSFRFAHMEPIQHMGTFGALGVIYAFFLSMTLLPALLTFNTRSLLGTAPQIVGSTAPPPRDRTDRFLAACNRLSSGDGGRRRMLLVAVALVAVAVAGAARLQFHHDPIEWFPEDAPVKHTVAALSEHVGGTGDVSVLIEARAGQDLRDREVLLALERFEQHAFEYRDPRTGEAVVRNATSLLDVVRESWRALHDDDPARYRVPESQRGVVDVLTLFESASPDDLKRIATIDWQKSLLSLRVTWLPAQGYVPLTEYLQRGIDEIFGERATVVLTGTVYNSTRVVAQLLEDLTHSFAAALIAITLMMIALLRDLKLGLISMLPNLLPIAGLISLMGFLGIPIDVNNLLIGSIAIGIAVDDTIHFLHHFKAHYDARGHVDEAIELAFRHAGRAMVNTSAILVGGFLVMLTGEMASSHTFGILVSCSVVFALLADLAIAPAVLRTFYRNRPGSQTGRESSRFAQERARPRGHTGGIAELRRGLARGR